MATEQIAETELKELTLWTYLKNSVQVGFNTFLDLIPITACYVILLKTSDDLTVSTLTLTISCFFLAFAYSQGFMEAQGIRCGVYYGEENRKAFGTFFYRLVMLNTFMCVCSAIFIFNSKSLLIYCNVRPKLSENVSHLLMMCLFAKAVETYLFQLKSILLSQKIFHPFFKLNFISLVNFLACALFFIYYLDMKLKGFAICLTCKILLETVMVLYFIRKYVDLSFLVRPSFAELFNGLWIDLKFIFYVSIQLYIEIMMYVAVDILIATIGKEKLIVTWGLTIDIGAYSLYFFYGNNNTIRAYLSYQIGRNDVEKYKEQRNKCLLYSLVLMLISVAIFLPLAPHIGKLYSKDKEVLDMLVTLNYILTGILPLSLYVLIFGTLLKTIGQEFLQFCIGLFINPLLTLVNAYLLLFTFEYGIIGARASYFPTGGTVLLVMVISFLFTEPKLIKRMREKRNQQNELTPLR